MNQALAYLNTHAAPGARIYKRCFEPGHLAWMRGDLELSADLIERAQDQEQRLYKIHLQLAQESLAG